MKRQHEHDRIIRIPDRDVRRNVRWNVTNNQELLREM